MLTKFLEIIGGFMIRRFEEFGTIILLYVDTMKQLTHKPRIRHIIAQMAHLGVDSLTIVSLTLLFMLACWGYNFWRVFFEMKLNLMPLKGNYH